METSGHSHGDQTRVLLEECLRQTFVKPASGIIGKLFGVPEGYSYEIKELEPYECAGSFPEVQLLWAVVDGTYLDVIPLPSSQSRGLFAVCGDESWYLQRSNPRGLTKLLRLIPDLKTIVPSHLATVICDALLSEKNTRHLVLRSADDLVSIASNRSGFKIDNEEMARVRKTFCSAEYESTNDPREIRLKFTTLYGWMHEAKRVVSVAVTIYADCEVKCTEEVLSDKIFSSVPGLRY